MMDFKVPEGCVSHVLSLTSPADTCRSAAVSKMFRSAAESDELWEKFLPSDYRDIISRATDESVISSCSSKKQLFFRLCQQPILIDGGKFSFMLEKSTGKKCYMLSARELWITWGDTPQYWNWTSMPDSRFAEVAELYNVCWLDISGKLDSATLTPKTVYEAYFIFKLHPSTRGFDHPLPVASVSIGEQSSNVSVSVHSKDSSSERVARRRQRGIVNFNHLLMNLEPTPVRQAPEQVTHFSRSREDGWMELVLGEFFNEDGTEGFVEFRLKEIEGGHWKSGLIVHGIEVRPKK